MDRLQRHRRLHSLDPRLQKATRHESDTRKIQVSSKILLPFLLLLLTVPTAEPAALGAPSQSTSPTVLIWSNNYRTSNITDPALVSGTLIIEFNITNAPAFNAFDLTLYYDWRFINASIVDTSTGTVLGTNPIFVYTNLDVQGEAQIAVAASEPYQGMNGTLAHITFTVTGAGISPLVLGPTSIVSVDPTTSSTQEVFPETKGGFFKNTGNAKQGPIALFTYSPQSIVQGDPITFDASSSLDPDNSTAANQGINAYAWRFGDSGSLETTDSVTTYTYASPFGGPLYGSFYVILTVADQDTYVGINVQRLTVQQRPRHDIEIFSIAAQPTSVQLGAEVLITVKVRNLGTTGEVFNMTVDYGPPSSVLASLVTENIEVGQTLNKQFTMKTNGLAPSHYLVTASVAIPADEESSNNEKSTVVRVTEASDGFLGLRNPYLLLPIVAVAGGVIAIRISRRKRPRPGQE